MEKEKPLKGLLVEVYRASGYNCTNGISKTINTVVLVGEGVPEIFEATEERPAVKVVRRNFGGREYLHAEPVVKNPQGTIGYMAGGNFVFTSDSRFPSQYPLSLHDRYETPEQYAALSQ